MKRIIGSLVCMLLLITFTGCGNTPAPSQVMTTTLPIFTFTDALCNGTGISVSQLITEDISCLHDYTLKVPQMRAIESADVLIISGAGLESFLSDTGTGTLSTLHKQLDDLQSYADIALADLSCRDIITFHDGFAYMAQAFNLTILKAVQEEAGSEASAKELIELIEITQEYSLPAVFTETNGNSSAASVIAAQSGAKVYPLSTAMSGDSYFDAMYKNINTLTEALE